MKTEHPSARPAREPRGSRQTKRSSYADGRAASNQQRPAPAHRKPRKAAPKTAKPAGDGSSEATLRLQLVLAQAGIASRRRAADMIRAGRVRVNAKVVREPGHPIMLGRDQVNFDNQPIPPPEKKRTIMMNKPVGLLCSADGAQGRTVCDLIADVSGRLVPVGRLDRDSGGLLLLSNDGPLIAHLTHPRYGHRKIYRVEVSGPCNAATLARLREPMEIDGYTLRPVQVTQLRKQGGHTWLRFVLFEGRNRQIRKMCAQVGLNIISLTRIAIDNLQLPDDLAPGEWRELSAREVRALMTTQDT